MRVRTLRAAFRDARQPELRSSFRAEPTPRHARTLNPRALLRGSARYASALAPRSNLRRHLLFSPTHPPPKTDLLRVDSVGDRAVGVDWCACIPTADRPGGTLGAPLERAQSDITVAWPGDRWGWLDRGSPPRAGVEVGAGLVRWLRRRHGSAWHYRFLAASSAGAATPRRGEDQTWHHDI